MSERQRPLVLNGRAAAREKISGVERWALELMPRLVSLRPDRYRVFTPPAAFTHRAGHAWEQVVLPARAARAGAGLIFSPANIAPVAWPRNVVILHDAATVRNASDYTRAFRLWHEHVGLASARRALAVITVSEFSRNELLALTDLDPSKLHVIPAGVDERFSTGAEPAAVTKRYGLNRPYVLTVGTSDARKNFSVLSEVIPTLTSEGLEVVWAGGERGHIGHGDEAQGLRRLGYVPDEDLPALYAGARAFVLPSRYEGFGLPCLEAMASGTPVVAAARAALPETCGDAALLVDPDDPRELAAAILAAAIDDSVRDRLREAGRRRTATSSWDRVAERVDRLLMSVATG